MKARTGGSSRTGCEAVQYSDQMQCARCSLAYDVNDPDPPECKPQTFDISREVISTPQPEQNGPKNGRAVLERLGL